MLVWHMHFNHNVTFDKRMMNEPTSDLTAIQSENVLKTSRHITRIKDDDQETKALLAG